MTKGRKIFRIVVCILLALTIIWSVFWGLFLMTFGKNLVLANDCNILIAGKSVTNRNADDILGDGTVYYDLYNNILTFNNAKIDALGGIHKKMTTN